MKQKQWLLLLYQLPAKSDTERVRLWRRLQKIGAVMVKNSVSAFPDTAFFRQIVVSIASEIVLNGGEAIVTEGNFIFGLSNESLAQSYNAQLDSDYKLLAQEIQDTTKKLSKKPSSNDLMKSDHKRTKFFSRLSELEKRTISPVDGKDRCKTSLDSFENKIAGAKAKELPNIKSTKPKSGSTWVTRKNLHVDRLASAWLIKKYIDPRAQFLFVNLDRYAYKPSHIRFDVFRGEFGHVGDKCTFEVLVEQFKIKSVPIVALAEIIHDLDIQDDKFERKETEGIRMAIDGIIRSYRDDHERLLSAMNLFDSLALSLKEEKS